MKIHSIARIVLCAAMVLGGNATAAEAQRLPDPERPQAVAWTLTIERLLKEGVHASSTAERRLVHDDLVLVLRDGI
jgi:hypothetical protein